MKTGYARQRRKNGRRRSGRRGSERNGRRKSEKRENVKTGKNERKRNMTSTTKEDIRMMMATERMRGAIVSGIAIAIALLAIVPLIATVNVRIADRTAKKYGPNCPNGEIRARASHISYLKGAMSAGEHAL